MLRPLQASPESLSQPPTGIKVSGVKVSPNTIPLSKGPCGSKSFALRFNALEIPRVFRPDSR